MCGSSGIAKRSVRWNPRTGAVLDEYGAQTGVHALSKGRFLLEKYGVFELRGTESGSAPLSFTLDEGNSHRVFAISDDEIVVPVYESLGTVSLRTGEPVCRATGHTKPIEGLFRAGNNRWLTHARSLPGLNERFGFDGTLRVFEEATWDEVAHHDTKAPIRALLPLTENRFAVLLDHSICGRSVPIFDFDRGKITGTIEGPKKEVLGVLPLPNDRALVWAKDKTARIVATA